MRRTMTFEAVLAAFAAFAISAEPATAAYSCTVTPDGKSVLVKMTNPDPFPKSCTVNCQFRIPGGGASVSCSKTVPADVKDWTMCTRSTGGDKYTFREGDEDCRRQ